MAISVTHTFVSPVADDGDPNEVGPNEWNAAHTISGLGTAAEADSTDFATAAQGAKADTAVQPAAIANMLETSDIGVSVQAHSAVLDATTASFLTAQETKLGHISVTQAVDLDAIETRVNALDAAVVLRGSWDASAGTFPGGGTAQAGDSYIVSVAGTVDSVAFVLNDRIIAITDNASTTTFAANWFKADYTDQVLSVAGKTGAVALVRADISDASAFGQARMADAAAEDARNALDTAAYVATRTALKALDTTKETVALLAEAGREGTFIWMTGDYSTQITADTQEGIYVKATAIASTSGSWVRVYAGALQAEWFGLSASGSAAANKTALNAALALSAFLTGGIVELPLGTIACDNGITHTGLEPLILRGQGMGVTVLSATAGANFLTINPSPFSAVDIILEDLTVQQASSGVTNTGIIIARCTFRANRLGVRGFSIGMYLDEAYSFDVVECAFNNQATHGIQATANTANNAAIVRTFFGGIGVSIFGPAIRIESAENVIIQGCQFEQNGRDLRMDDCNSVAFIDNYSEYEADVPINFVGTNYNVVIQRNTFALYTNSWALENVVELTMTDNWLFDCTTTIATTCLRPVVERNKKTGTGTFPSVNVTPRVRIVTVQGSAVALTNNITTAQSVFAAANDTLTVETGLYRFRARIALNTGATSHTTAFGLGGTATFAECRYSSLALSSADLTLGTPQMRRVTSNSAAVLTAASTEVRTDLLIEGTMRISAAGTIIPQITFSAGPTGTCEVTIGSFFEIVPIGSDTEVAVGPWA